jgi:hypothetical protein
VGVSANGAGKYREVADDLKFYIVREAVTVVPNWGRVGEFVKGVRVVGAWGSGGKALVVAEAFKCPILGVDWPQERSLWPGSFMVEAVDYFAELEVELVASTCSKAILTYCFPANSLGMNFRALGGCEIVDILSRSE